MKALKIAGVVLGVLMVVCGAWCLSRPETTYLALGWAIGACMLIDGVGGIVTYLDHRNVGFSDRWTLLGSAISLVAGILILANEGFRFATDIIIAYLVATWLTVLGVVRIMNAWNLRSACKQLNGASNGGTWGWILAIGVLLTACGVLAFLHPIMLAIALGALLGVSAIVAGANLIALALA